MDKVCDSTANKSTIGYVVPRGYEPYSEFRPYEEISKPMAPSAILQRGTPSVVNTGGAYKVLIELKRKQYELLTGENFDEVLKQKQPWMVHEDKPIKESLEMMDVTESEIVLLESVFDLNRTSDGYISSKYYFAGDVIISLDADGYKDYSSLFENFGHNNPNVVYDEEINCVIAMEDIEPGVILSM